MTSLDFKHWLTGAVIYSGEGKDLRDVLVKAVRAGANLGGAYLDGAYLGDWERGPDGYARHSKVGAK